MPTVGAEELEQLTDLAWRYSEPGRASDVVRGLTTSVQEVGWDSTPDDQPRALLNTRSYCEPGARIELWPYPAIHVVPGTVLIVRAFACAMLRTRFSC